MLKKQKYLELEKGLSLIEASMVLALAAIVVSGVLYYFNTAKNNENLMENIRTLNNITGVINKFYLGYGSNKPYDGLSNSLIAKALPGIKLGDDGRIQLAGDIKLTIETKTDQAGYKYLYTYLLEDVPSGQCQEYVTTLTNFQNVKVTWVFMENGAWGVGDKTQAENLANLRAACAELNEKTFPKTKLSAGLTS